MISNISQVFVISNSGRRGKLECRRKQKPSSEDVCNGVDGSNDMVDAYAEYVGFLDVGNMDNIRDVDADYGDHGRQG